MRAAAHRGLAAHSDAAATVLFRLAQGKYARGHD